MFDRVLLALSTDERVQLAEALVRGGYLAALQLAMPTDGMAADVADADVDAFFAALADDDDQDEEEEVSDA